MIPQAPRHDRRRQRWREGSGTCCSNVSTRRPSGWVHRGDLAEIGCFSRYRAANGSGGGVQACADRSSEPTRTGGSAPGCFSAGMRAIRRLPLILVPACLPARSIVVKGEPAPQSEALRQHEGRDEGRRPISRAFEALGGDRVGGRQSIARSHGRHDRRGRARSSSSYATAASPEPSHRRGGNACPWRRAH